MTITIDQPTAAEPRRAPTLEARLEKLIHEFIHRPYPHGLNYERERRIHTDTENLALFHLLGQLEAMVSPHARALTKTRLADAVARSLEYALTQEQHRWAELGVTLAPDVGSKGVALTAEHTPDATGLCASDCPACAAPGSAP